MRRAAPAHEREYALHPFLARKGAAIKRRSRELPRKQEETPRLNSDITHPQVRLIGDDGTQLGVMTSAKALSFADEQGLDLVEIAAQADPPVCRIMNYDKFRYEKRKKEQEAKKKRTVIEVKEVKFRPKTEEHDLNFKIKNIKKFLAQKNKVKVTLRFRGREIVYAHSLGVEVLRRIRDSIGEDGVVLQQPLMEGRQMVMMVGPK